MGQRSANVAGELALREAHAAWKRGDPTSAEAACRRALAMGVDDAPAWALLGMILRQKDPLAAESALKNAITRDARNPDAHFQLGNLHRAQRNYRAAISAYERTLALVPGQPSVLNNLGLALDAAGETARAVQAWHDALRREPAHRQALTNLARTLCREADYHAATAVCEKFLRHYGDAEAELWIDYGICQHHLGNNAGAERSFRRALELVPDDPPTLTNLASVLVARNDFEGAEPVLARAVALAPGFLHAIASLANCRQHLCRWDGLDELHEKITNGVAEDSGNDWSVNPFFVLSMSDSPVLQLKVAQRWAASFAPAAPPHFPTEKRARRKRDGKLRLGYVSSDFRHHAIAALLTEVWERHDRSRFATHAYSIGPRECSPLRTRIEAAFDHFADCFEEDAADTARRIREDGVDVLIDLNGYTTCARTRIFALRPAPVQLGWLGYLGTMGADFIDYVVTDDYVTPPEAQPHFTERFLRLPHCYCPSDTRRIVEPNAPSRDSCGLPSEGFVYCCFNNGYKIRPSVFDVWMRLLAGVPRSVLWLASGSPTSVANLRHEATQRGIDPERLVFAPRVPPPEHLARHACADLFIDTLPYNAGTMTNDALFMGLPVLTCVGSTMAGRVAASQLHAIGLAELAVNDLASYEATALQLAREPSSLAFLRARLAENRRSHPLFDMARFTRDLEDSLLRVASDVGPGNAPG